MGIAVIIPNVNYGDANLGKVTLQQGVPLRSMTIVGPDEVTEPTIFSVNFFPANTSQRGIVWSVQSGGTYASIDADTGELTPIVGAVASEVVIRATSTDNNTIYAEKTVSVSYGMVYEERAGLVGDGTARMSIGYVVNKRNTKIKYDYVVNSLPAATSTPTYRYVWGSYRGESYPTTRHMLTIVTAAATIKQQIRFGASTTTSYTGVQATTLTQLSTNVRYKQEISMDGFVTDKDASIFSEYNYGGFYATDPDRPITLFAGGSASGYVATEMTLYGFEILEGNNVAMKLVPCTLLQNIPGDKAGDGNSHLAGENGLWDKVGQKFYGNTHADGLGTFGVI